MWNEWNFESAGQPLIGLIIFVWICLHYSKLLGYRGKIQTIQIKRNPRGFSNERKILNSEWTSNRCNYLWNSADKKKSLCLFTPHFFLYFSYTRQNFSPAVPVFVASARCFCVSFYFWQRIVKARMKEVKLVQAFDFFCNGAENWKVKYVIITNATWITATWITAVSCF